MSRSRHQNALTLPTDLRRSHETFLQIARAIVGDEASAEDAVQGAYLTALSANRSSRGPSWWKRVVRSRSVDILRERVRSESGASSGRPGDASSLHRPAPATGEIAESLELQRVVLAAVEALREPYREAVYLRFYEQRMPSEIADVLNVPVKTVKTRIGRGVELLRSRLEARGVDAHWRDRLAIAGALARPPYEPLAVPSGTTSTALSVSGTLVHMKKAFVVLGLLAASLVAWRVIATTEGPLTDGVRQRTSGDPMLSSEASDDGTIAAIDSESDERALVSTLRDPIAAAVKTGSLRVHALWPEDDDAENVALLLGRKGNRWDPRGFERRATGPGGTAEFENLTEGTYELRALRGVNSQATRVEIVRGERTEVTLKIPMGVHVSGIVRAPGGGAVAGAEVWLTSRAPGIFGGRTVQASDAEGRFELRHVPPDQSLGAMAPGFAPSELVDLDLLDVSGSAVEIELLLAPGGCTLELRVSDDAGDPIGGALVALTSAFPERREMHPNGAMAERWTARSVVTSHDGSAVAHGLLPGRIDIAVQASDFGIWEGEATLQAPVVTRVEVRMERSGTLRGVLTDPQGQPVVGGSIRVFRNPVDERFLQTGQLPSGGIFGREIAQTDSTGAYRLDGLAPGETFAYAQARKDPNRRMGAPVVWDSTVLVIESGTEATWNPRLDPGNVIIGSIVYADGSPMKGVFVVAENSETEEAFAQFAESGEFEFIRLDAVSHVVQVQLNDAPPGAAPLRAEGVVPNGAPIELRAEFGPPGSGGTATIRARFEDRAERAGGDVVRLRLESPDTRKSRTGELEGEVWTFTEIFPGRARVIATAGERLIARTEIFEVKADEDLDLGIIESRAGGALHIELVREEEGSELSDVHVSVRGKDAIRGQSFAVGRGTSHHIEGLEPGETTVMIFGQNVVQEHASTVIEPGGEALVTLEVQRGVRVPYVINWDVESTPSLVQFTVKSPAGKIINDRQFGSLARHNGSFEFSFRAPLGVYEYEASASDGRSCTGTVEVRTLDQEPEAPIQIELR